ncbi:hypothetical protein BAUCODRAFT_39452 [Baudoinia panamericana UAMH 10762]|uniref:Protein BIG1 n=1 Tax=Baudoinia panamericana (strain UAMH 10762) TaxID=717646 RepID=M2MXA9_BAUPA|nr:uncharacterized protein BAUCODRAFT_39452 [Baudoinia panamericana UAMH 10762]EMC91289.1 hypothetical protein BAUCODRAFT_39452 [Baudoinia panamericana UAMH 10762]
MLLRSVCQLLLATSTVQAFKDAHPFFMLLSDPSGRYSNSPLPQIASSGDVETQVLDALSGCEHDAYVIFTQPGARADDVMSMARLREQMAKGRNETLLQTSEALGSVNADKLADALARKCSLAESTTKHLITKPLQPLTMAGDDRKTETAMSDVAITRYLDELSSKNMPYVLIYAASAIQQDPPYEMDEEYPSALHIDLKRDISAEGRRLRQRQSNVTDNTQYKLPLFETYQFLSPAIFMGLTVTLLLFLIGYVGVSAIAGLEVSYAAFSKEMGPQAQNKGKQQ